MNPSKNSMALVFVAWVIVVVWTPWSQAANLQDMKPYEVEEGRIEFKLSGMTKGSEVLEFKDWGRKAATRSNNTVSIMGMTQETHQLTIIDGEWVYNVDLSKNTATKIKNPFYAGLAEQGNQDLQRTGEDLLKAMGGKKVGKDTILGKTCDWWEIEQLMSKSCIWKGIGLKTIGGLPGMEIVHTAVNIQLSKISDSRFSLPPNVKVVKGEDPLKQLREFQSQSGTQRPQGLKDAEGRTGAGPQGEDMPNMQEMMEQIKKMQEEMQKRGLKAQ